MFLHHDFSLSKGLLLKYGFTIDEPEVRKDDTVCDITINRLLSPRSIKFDETELRLGSDKDMNGSCSKTLSNPTLNRSGARHTRSSGHVKSVSE